MMSLLDTLIQILQDLKTVNDQKLDILLSFLIDHCLTNVNNKLQLFYFQQRKSI